MADTDKTAPTPGRFGWLTSDEEEIAVRRLRAESQSIRLTPHHGEHEIFRDYLASSEADAARQYIVEFRSLNERCNWCACPDFEKNGLGTCKHIERAVSALAKAHATVSESPFVEVFMVLGDDPHPMVQQPDELNAAVRAYLRPYVNVLGQLKRPWQTTLAVFLRSFRNAPAPIRACIRVSREVHRVAQELARRRQLELSREAFEQQIRDGARTPHLVRYPLYDYQLAGVMHLAFTGRAMLADEMGLGKTVQAIAACKVLQELWDVARVLVVAPASLKSEWDEQIRKFTDLPAHIVYGNRDARLQVYETTRAVFVLTNYEQVLRDEHEINTVLRPDVLILDEAQRIKNWRTKTAKAIKRLASRFAFVLTGTPLENRIDDIYSLVEFVDPRIFGSLFRFNRAFYQLDERGKPTGFKNIRKLQERLQPIMLRRRKRDVSEQLPARVDNNYFVPLSKLQRARYEEYAVPACRLLSIGQRRPLRKDEQDRLQRLLACMRMTCDSLHIIDEENTEAPKLDELEKILTEVWDIEPDRKVIVFSEWQRMLALLQRRLDEQDIIYALHTGKVAQQRRHQEVERFKTDPACRLLLSTDAGGTGLNLQIASMIVNLDLPWNPARLEQRIARAWRAAQERSVSVVNLVAEKTIEHRMLTTLSAKQDLANAVLRDEDGPDELSTESSGLLQRLTELIGSSEVMAEATREGAATEPPPVFDEPAAPLPLSEQFRQNLSVELGERLQLCKAGVNSLGGIDNALIVVDGDAGTAREIAARILRESGAVGDLSRLQVIDREQFQLLTRLSEAGLIEIREQAMTELARADGFGEPVADDTEHRRRLIGPLLTDAERQVRMAEVLRDGGFPIEACAPVREGIDLTGRVLMVLCATTTYDAAPNEFRPALIAAIKGSAAVSPASIEFLGQHDQDWLRDDTAAAAFVAAGRQLLDETRAYALRYRL